MHTKARSTPFLLVILVILLVGCGGGGGGGQDDQQGGGADKKGKPEARKNAPETKIALGTVKRVNYDKERLVIKPSQGEGLMTFGVRSEAKITVDDKKVELADVKKGQQAQIEYIQNNKLKRARSLQLFSASDGAKD